MVGIYQRFRESAVSIFWVRNATEDWGRTSVHFYQITWRHIPDDILRLCVSFIFWRTKAPDKFHYEFTNIKWIKQNSTPPLPPSPSSFCSAHASTEFHFARRKTSCVAKVSISEKRYDELLGDTYSPDIIVTQTTDLNRTKIAAHLKLPGLWHSAVPRVEPWTLATLLSTVKLSKKTPEVLHVLLGMWPLLAFRNRNQPKRNTKQYRLESVSL
jgi:hypothetical protein